VFFSKTIGAAIAADSIFMVRFNYLLGLDVDWVFDICECDLGGTVVHGRDGVLLARLKTALGRVLEQVFQRSRVQIHSNVSRKHLVSRQAQLIVDLEELLTNIYPK
jgi:hypothetical protein